ncbi:hypothetical protein ACJIZ3_011039 [Penstemon smallii]|uniref:PPM-type phosphatase domain-containing protein n=1 Tax=Penstemon smallii TaxID=265156 RepID=A0ABD3ULM6_9LAMI
MLPKSGDHQTVPLSVLLKRELANGKIERPEILHGQASQSKKGEDFTFVKTECQRVLGDGVTTYSLFDGHNGSAAAIYAKENLLNNVLGAIPPDLNSEEWISALPRALVAGFVKTDKDFQEKAQTSGTTVTFVIIEGWVITSIEGGIYYLSADHKLDCSEEERERITGSGGEVGRLNTGGGTEIGPLRCWPGGLCRRIYCSCTLRKASQGMFLTTNFFLLAHTREDKELNEFDRASSVPSSNRAPRYSDRFSELIPTPSSNSELQFKIRASGQIPSSTFRSPSQNSSFRSNSELNVKFRDPAQNSSTRSIRSVKYRYSTINK